jgi:hypothetical protein
MEILASTARTLAVTVWDVLPIAAIIFGFQLFVIKRKIANLERVLLGFAYVLLGLCFFLEGLERALFPLGRLMAEQLTDPAFVLGEGASFGPTLDWRLYFWVSVFAAAVGFSTTIAEPALIAVAIKAKEVSGGTITVWGLRIAVAIGVAIGLSLGTFRIVTGTPLHYYIICAEVHHRAGVRFRRRHHVDGDGAAGGGAGAGPCEYRPRT